MLDNLNARSVVIDRHGDAWQSGVGSVGMYWYQAYGDSSEVDSWALSQSAALHRDPQSVGGKMFALKDEHTHDWARMINGQRFIYSSRSTAQIAARILAKHHKTHYVVTDA